MAFPLRRNVPEPLTADPYLAPYAAELQRRSAAAEREIARLTGGGKLADFADAADRFGLHRRRGGWVFREYAPHAVEVWLVGDFSAWEPRESYRLRRPHLSL